MARPTKTGLDYFPLDCVLDEKFELIEAEFGLTGFAIIIKVMQRIYGEQGYYCKWNSEVALLFSRKIGVGGNVVEEVIESALRRGIFSRNLFEKYGILTSRGIQKRYFEAVNRRKQIETKKEYLLIKVALQNVNVCNNQVNVDNNSINAGRKYTKESKVKESKVKESRERLRRAPTLTLGKFDNVYLTEEELIALKKNYSNNYEAKIQRLSTYLATKNKHYDNHYAVLVSWLDEDVPKKATKESSNASYDLDEIESKSMFDD